MINPQVNDPPELNKASQTEPVGNPYVGPRAFRENESQFFFGRNEEVEILTSLVMTSRVTLFFAQSGAGKSSLLRAGLIPELTRLQDVGRGKRTRTHQKMQVLPVATVGGGVPQGLDTSIDNIFVFNALFSMQPDMAPGTLANQTLASGVSALLTSQPAPDQTQEQADQRERTPLSTLLILDQFEEIFTTHLDHWPERKLFFQQISDLLEAQPTVHVLFSMREDYIAELTPYRNLLPNQLQLRDHFRIEPLKREAALEAVTAPAERAGRQFAEGVAEDLVDNLRRIQVSIGNLGQDVSGSAAGEAAALGAYIEPVHLQIVCQQLWANLPAHESVITAESVEAFGDVDQALIGFYEAALAKVLAHPRLNLSERLVRLWFNQQLMTPARTKGLVYRGTHITEGLINSAVDILVDAYIIRADIRGGDTWYELAHDRLIEPVLTANQAWLVGNQNPLATATQTWLEAQRNPAQLLKGIQLQDASRYAEQNRKDVTALEREFLAASSSNLSALARAAQEWYDAERNPDKLLEGNQLVEAQLYAQEFQDLVGPEEARFLEASVKQEAIELNQAAISTMRRQRLIISGIVVFIIMALLTAASLWFYTRSVIDRTAAEDQARIAQTNEAAAVKAEAESTRSRGIALNAAETARANAQKASTAEAQALQNFRVASTQIRQAFETSTAEAQAYQTADAATGEAIVSLAVAATRIATLEADRQALLNVQAETNASIANNPLGQFLTSLNLLPTITPNEVVVDAGIRATQDMATQTAAYLQITETPSPTPTATPNCQLSPADTLFPFWEQYQERLGCPIASMAIPGQLFWQPFSNGDVFWTGSFQSYLILVGADLGQWSLIHRDNLLSDPRCNPSKLLDETMQTLICGQPEISNVLGQPLPGGSTDDLVARGFTQGFIWRRGENDVYTLFADDQTYIHKDLLDPDLDDTAIPDSTAAPTPVALPDPPASQLIFSSNRSSEPNVGNLYLMDADGQNVSRLTELNGSEPNYARANRRLVFSRQSPEAQVQVSLYRLDLAGAGEPLSIGQQTEDNWEPAISPDGETVAFVSSRQNLNWEIYTTDLNGANLIQLTACPELDPEWLKWAPAWSPDGEQIAFVVSLGKPQYSGQASIWLVDKNGEKCRPLTNNFDTKGEVVDKFPDWSPDGKRLVFVSNRRGLFELYLMNADGSDIRPVPNARPDANYPAWSPDGNWLAFAASTTAGDYTPDDIFIITISGDAQTNLTNRVGESWYPVWARE